METISFADKLARVNANGEIEISRLINAKTGELAWNVVPTPTAALIKATAKLRQSPPHYVSSETAYGRTTPLSFAIRCF